MASDILRHLFSGFVRLHILYHADKEPICGVEIMEELRHHGYKIGPGTLYPVLHELEEAGYLRAANEIVKGKRRKNLRTTTRGRKLLVEAREKVAELASEIIDDKDALAERKKRGHHDHGKVIGEIEI
jgi:PadR family transcriptional regulator, regulatory protein PadR